MGINSGSSSRVHSVRHQFVLSFQDVDNGNVENLAARLEHQKESCGMTYNLLKVTESDLIILVYPIGEKSPKLSDFANFKEGEFKNYKRFSEINDIIKFNVGKRIRFKKANIRRAKTEDNKRIYWIKYI